MPAIVKDVIDIVCKLAIVAGIAVFLFLQAHATDVGRYAYITKGELEYVMDTSTGVIYQNGYSMNHITGKESSPGKPHKP